MNNARIYFDDNGRLIIECGAKAFQEIHDNIDNVDRISHVDLLDQGLDNVFVGHLKPFVVLNLKINDGD